MESTAKLLRELISTSGMSPHHVSIRAGVSPSTVSRALHGQVEPGLTTLREIALACGFELDIGPHCMSDRFAAMAARSMLEDGYVVPIEHEVQVSEWIIRFGRALDITKSIDLVEAAGRASAPLLRAGAIKYKGDVPLSRVASSGHASNGPWAISGLPGLTLDSRNTLAPPVTLLWCTNVKIASQLIADKRLTRTENNVLTSVVLVEAESEMFTDSFEHDGITFAAPIQIMLDCFGIGGSAAELARQEVLSW
jgi:transcriptional regulator with XRE-family HTH domain